MTANAEPASVPFPEDADDAKTPFVKGQAKPQEELPPSTLKFKNPKTADPRNSTERIMAAVLNIVSNKNPVLGIIPGSYQVGLLSSTLKKILKILCRAESS